MSIRNVVLFTDDTTGETGDDVSTRRFSLDGQEWEIELSEANWEKLCKIVKPFTDAARKPKGNTPPRRHRASPLVRETRPMATVTHIPASTTTIRQWALARGLKVSKMGRIPASIMAEYNAAAQRTA